MIAVNLNTYFSDVEEAFMKARGRGGMISPRDWPLLAEWEDAGIPLWMVTQIIEEVADNHRRSDSSGDTPRTLRYYDRAIRERFTAWQRGRAGSHEDASPSRQQEADEALDDEKAATDAPELFVPYVCSTCNGGAFVVTGWVDGKSTVDACPECYERVFGEEEKNDGRAAIESLEAA